MLTLINDSWYLSKKMFIKKYSEILEIFFKMENELFLLFCSSISYRVAEV